MAQLHRRSIKMQPIYSAILLAACLVLVQGGALRDQVQANVKKCVAETKVSAEEAKIAYALIIPKTEAESCYMECIYKSTGIIKDGKFSVDGAKKLTVQRFTNPAEKTAADKLIDTCSKEIVPGKDKCALGKSVRECFAKNGSNISFFPPPS